MDKNTIEIIGVTGIPEVRRGDDIGELIVSSADTQNCLIRENDIFVIAQIIVTPRYTLYFLMSFCFNDTHAMTIVTLERINMIVLNVACGTVSMSMCNIEPCSPIGGQIGAPVLSKIYAEKRPPNSITSDAKKSHIPNFALYNPVSFLVSTLYGISIICSLINFVFVE